jgi:hypothetical protein
MLSVRYTRCQRVGLTKQRLEADTPSRYDKPFQIIQLHLEGVTPNGDSR